MKKLKLTILFSSIALACIVAGCNKPTPVEENKESGYIITVKYDANGGSFLNRPGITVMDMFNPTNYEKDTDGKVQIKLKEPTDPTRPTSGSDNITLTLQDHFFAGWYQNREVRTVDGKPVDENGAILEQREDGTYIYAETAGTDSPKVATPAYNYSGYWDFENDRIEYSGSEPFEMTLYAGWVPYYEFHYYYKVGEEWTKLNTVTMFDYKMTNAVESQGDKDTIYLPRWENGAMNYKSTYQDNSEYIFPSIVNTTFESAYTNADCTDEINGSLVHSGNLKKSVGEEKSLVVENRVQNVYLKVSEGVQYRIETAQQFIDNANAEGYYEIAEDLDFSGLTWPMTFAAGEFSGKIYGKDNKKIVLSNITVEYVSDKTYGGLFGKVLKSAEITDVEFRGVSLNLIKTGKAYEAEFGLFAGEVEDGASLSVKIDGAIAIGKINSSSNFSLHLVANGALAGIEAGTIGLSIYGEQLLEQYEYTVNPERVTVAGDGTVTVEFYPSSELKAEEKYIIQ